MFRAFIAVLCVFFLTGPCRAQTSLSERMDGIETRMKAIEDTLARVEAKVDALKPKAEIVKAPEPKTPWTPIADVAPHAPTPPTPNCQCGCTVTGQCTCKDCDHPALVKPKTVTAAPTITQDASPAVYYYSAPQAYYSAPATSGACANGQCGTARQGVFRRFR